MIDEKTIPSALTGNEEKSWKQVVDTLAFLRTDDGCSWDKEQSMGSIIVNLIEEASELIDSLHRFADNSNEESKEHLIEEFGDLNLVLIMMMLIFEEGNKGSIREIFTQLQNKLIRRHPHVFSHAEIKNNSQLHEQWHNIKYHVEGKRDPVSLEEYKPYLHILERVKELQKKAEKLGLKEALNYSEKFSMLVTSIGKLKDAETDVPGNSNQPSPVNLSMLLGRCLYELIDLSRSLRLSPSTCLSMYVSKQLQQHEADNKAKSQNR